MRFRLTFLTGLSLLFMAGGLYLAFAGVDGPVGKRYFFITLGILGWFIGNRLVEIDERLAGLEKLVAEQPRTTASAESPHQGDSAVPPSAAQPEAV